ncbi:hypothetical protein GCM10023264_18560 [Sphingomonas daechungensis]
MRAARYAEEAIVNAIMAVAITANQLGLRKSKKPVARPDPKKR